MPTAPQKSSRPFFIVVGALGLAAVLGGIVGAYNVARGPVFETLRATRLAPLPRAAVDVTSHSEVQPAGYKVQVSFEAPLPEIDAWIKRSPSAMELTPEHPSPGTRRYVLPASKDAKSATVQVDEAKGVVQIDLLRG